MAMLEILHFPDPRLRQQAEKVKEVDFTMQKLVQDMLETMYASHGIGLAATQVGINKQLLVMDISEEHNQPLCLINPEILDKQGHTVYKEGCLSVPGTYEEVERYEKITIKALNEKAEEITFEAEGLKAICIQHEMDHLQGKLFIDYISTLKRERIKKKLQKQQRNQSKQVANS